MRAERELEERFMLKMNRQEAEWLKGVFQNPLIPGMNERDLDKDMRSRYFHAIEKVLGENTQSVLDKHTLSA